MYDSLSERALKSVVRSVPGLIMSIKHVLIQVKLATSESRTLVRPNFLAGVDQTRDFKRFCVVRIVRCLPPALQPLNIQYLGNIRSTEHCKFGRLHFSAVTPGQIADRVLGESAQLN